MTTTKYSGRLRAFTLIELILVIAIIALVAALLMPALTQSRARARRVQCVSQLRQAGLGFQAFAHDHNGAFPMAVPLSAGGTLELVQNAYRVNGEFYFAYRHFQALSNELTTPKILACPADTRLPAPNFAAFNNDHLSYFVGVRAEPGRPNSLLAGDRNLTNDWTGPSSILRPGASGNLRWTRGLHQFKGNLLFADGHVELASSTVLLLPTTPLAAAPEVFVPSVKGTSGLGPTAPTAAPAPSPGGNATPRPEQPNAAPPGTPPPSSPRGPDPAPAGQVNVTGARPQLQPIPPPAGVSPPPAPSNPATNLPSGPGPVARATPSPDTEQPWFLAYVQWVCDIAHTLVSELRWLLYLVLLAIVAAALAVRHHLSRQRKPQPPPPPSPGD